jgi:uncharacterized membrane protein (UPF0182 family)
MPRSWRLVLFGAFLLVAIVIPSIVQFYTDWLWFGETGYQDVFFRTLRAQGTVGAMALLIAFLAIFTNIRIALRAMSPRKLVVMTREGPLNIAIDRRRVQTIGSAVAVLIGVLFGLYASSRWAEWLFFQHGQSFGEVDPILGRDVGFYVFSLPFLETLRGFLLALVIVSMVVSLIVYVMAGAVDINLVLSRRLIFCSCSWRSGRIWTSRVCSPARRASFTGRRTSTSRSAFPRCGCSRSCPSPEPRSRRTRPSSPRGGRS